MKDIEKIYEKVEKRKQHLAELFKKDEENYDLWSGKEQIFDSHKMAVNITGTEMISLAKGVQASLVRSRLDIHVYPPDKYANPDGYAQANQEERMYYYGFNKADERLSLVGEANLLSSIAWQATVLGRIAVRVLVYEDEDEIIWDYLPLNPRFLTFSFDSEGLMWACYETFRSGESIYDEYKVEVKDDGKGVSVSDYWDRDHNVRYLTEDKTPLGKSWKHPFPKVPIIIQPVTVAPKVIDSSGVKVTSWGQSVFDQVKTPFRELNKMRSITATHAHLIAKAPLDYTYEDGQTPALETENMDFYAGALMKHPKSETIQSMKIADIPTSLMAMMGDLKEGIQRATYAELAPDESAHSGSALRILGQARRDMVVPREDTLNTVYTRICHMTKCQIITQDLTIPVRTVKNKQYEIFDMKPEFLDNDFYVDAEIIGQDVYDEVEALQRAQMLMQNRLMSREDVLERVMNEPDTQTQIAKMDIEEVESAIPELKLKKAIKIYMERGMPEEAQMAMEQLALLEIKKQQELAPLMQAVIGQQGGVAPATPTTTPTTTAPTPAASPVTPMGGEGV